jgi:hypothetical protein
MIQICKSKTSASLHSLQVWDGTGFADQQVVVIVKHKEKLMLKKLILTSILILTLGIISQAQTTRYFEFTTNCGQSGHWQDSTFIAAATNPVLIDTVLANLARPINQRKFISGPIDYGDGGHNHNATHWFSWHFVPDQWNLVEMAAEVCDGCPYSAVDSDVTYWVANIGQFCPWSGLPVREVSNPSGIDEQYLEYEISIYPNPTKDNIYIKWNGMNAISVTFCNTVGQELSTVLLSKQNESINITNLQNGIYYVKIIDGKKFVAKKLIVY